MTISICSLGYWFLSHTLWPPNLRPSDWMRNKHGRLLLLRGGVVAVVRKQRFNAMTAQTHTHPTGMFSTVGVHLTQTPNVGKRSTLNSEDHISSRMTDDYCSNSVLVQHEIDCGITASQLSLVPLVRNTWVQNVRRASAVARVRSGLISVSGHRRA